MGFQSKNHVFCCTQLSQKKTIGLNRPTYLFLGGGQYNGQEGGNISDDGKI
jgi:hypothetical protein